MPLFLRLRHPVKIQGRGNVSCRGTKGSLIFFRPAEKPRSAFPRQRENIRGDTPNEKRKKKSLAACRAPEPSGSDSWENAAEAGLPFTNGKPAPSRRPCTASAGGIAGQPQQEPCQNGGDNHRVASGREAGEGADEGSGDKGEQTVLSPCAHQKGNDAR